MSTQSLRALCHAFKKQDHFLLSCHVDPEGDAVGSLLAMDSLLRRMGKRTMMVCEDPFPKRLPMLSSKRWRKLAEIKNPPSYFNALVTIDSPTLARIGKVQDLVTPDTTIFNIDHHVSNQLFGHFNYVDPKASACGEVVYDIFRTMRVPINREEAKNLYVSIMTDTGSFKYANTTVKCHRITAELIRTGIDVEAINNSIYSTYSLNKIQLYGRLLSRVKTSRDGTIAWVTIRRSDLTFSGADYEDTEGFIDFLKYMKEVKVAFLVMELPQKPMVRVSFRSKGNYDVNKIATYFHGGGHVKAAGCVIRSSLTEAVRMIHHVLRNGRKPK